MFRKVIIAAIGVILIILSINKPAWGIDSVYVWYGNVNSAPLAADTGQLVDINIYVMTTTHAYAADCLICLGAEDRCIDSLLSLTHGEIYYPFSEWDIKYFLAPQFSPPNQAGWSSQSFIGFSNMIPPYDSPWLHFDEPTIVLKMVGRTARNLSLVGELANCLGRGLNQQQGMSNFGDTLGAGSYPVAQYFSPLQFAGGGHVAGTVTNDSGTPLEGTIVRDIQTNRMTLTDDNGHYNLGGIYQGTHSISFDAPFYAETTVAAINVINNQTTPLNIEVSVLADIQGQEKLPDSYELKQNYPNPFNPQTTIEYALPKQSHVTVSVYDIQGRLVSTLVDQTQTAGRHHASWHAEKMPSGIYFYKIDAGDYSKIMKMTLIK